MVQIKDRRDLQLTRIQTLIDSSLVDVHLDKQTRRFSHFERFDSRADVIKEQVANVGKN
jgi:hypothetical protein